MNEPTNNGRMVLLMIAGLPVTMILAATWLWLYVEQGDIDIVDLLGTANHGQLLNPPRSVEELGLPLPSQDNTDWTILVPVSLPCDSDCEQTLYYTRQIRTAMGKDSVRISRAALGTDKAAMTELEQGLQSEHPKLKYLYTPQSRWDEVLQANTVDGEKPAYYLVDPRGWIMMSYLTGTDGKDVMADLKFLLKNSNG